MKQVRKTSLRLPSFFTLPGCLLSCLLGCLFFSTSCKDPSFLYTPAPPVEPQFYQQDYIIPPPNLDILWVIDNSGSMDSIHRNVLKNMEDFIELFTKRGLKWKMGLISTDVFDQPYLGFEVGNPFDYHHPDPVNTFDRAVRRLGTYGSATEQSFTPTVKTLIKNPHFLRDSANLAIIFVTDEKEQSPMDVKSFLDEIYAIKGESKHTVRMYAALRSRHLGCNTALELAGGKFDQVVTQTKGRVFSACAKDFGAKLSELANELSRLNLPLIISPNRRPLFGTITLNYLGSEVPGGPVEKGGVWQYDSQRHVMEIFDLSFIEDDEDADDEKGDSNQDVVLSIKFELDQGQRI